MDGKNGQESGIQEKPPLKDGGIGFF